MQIGVATVANSMEVPSVQFSCSVMSDFLWPHESQHVRPPCPSLALGVHSNSCPSSQWCHPAISSSVVPSPPVPNPLQHQGLFQWVNSLHVVAKVLEFHLQHQSFQWTGLISLRMDWLDLLAVPYKTKNKVTVWSSKTYSWGYIWRKLTWKNICTLMFTAALTIAKMWKQPKFSSKDEWIKIWCVCIYTHTHTHTHTGMLAIKMK